MRIPTAALCAAFLLVALAAAPAAAQSFSSGDLEGAWSLVQLSTPRQGVNASAITTLRSDCAACSPLTFDASGAVTGGVVADEDGALHTVSGGLQVSPAGLVTGTLQLQGPVAGSLTVQGARLLTGKHVVLGAATVFDREGLFALVKLEDRAPGTFALDPDLAGDWSYHELTPSNMLPRLGPGEPGEASWVRGTITFESPGGCAAADLALTDGTVRAQRTGDPASFECAGFSAGGVVSGTTAALDAQMTTDAAGAAASRDLVLGLTGAASVGAPGLVAMSKLTEDATFAPSALAGSWRVYLHRVQTGLETSATEVGLLTLTPAGALVTGTLTTAGPPAATTLLTTGSLRVTASGAVTGTLGAGSGATALRYSLQGTMRPAGDLITGVLTATIAGANHPGLVTLVREVAVFDLGQAAYAVAEGGSVTVTVRRTGNLAVPATVVWQVTGITAPPSDFDGLTSGTLVFAANSAGQTFTVKTKANALVDGNRSATIALTTVSGPDAMLGARASAALAIQEDDSAGTVKLGATTYPVAESARKVVLTLHRAGRNLASGVVVQLAIADGTAQAGRDYSLPANTSVTFAAGVTSRTVEIPILDNVRVDGTRTFTVTLTGISSGGTLGSPATTTVRIGDNEAGGTLQFGQAAYTVGEGGTATITVLRAPATAGGVLVDFTVAADGTIFGDVFTPAAGTLTFHAGNTSATFQVPTRDDGLVTGDTAVRLTLSNPRSDAPLVGPNAARPVLGARSTALLTVADAQKGLQFSAAAYGVSETEAAARITVTRTGPRSDRATIRYSTADGTALAGVHYDPAAGELTFPANGPAQQQFPVRIRRDRALAGPRTVLLLLSNANASAAPPIGLGPRNSAVLTINEADVPSAVRLGSAAIQVGEAVRAAVVTVTRTVPVTGGVMVDYATCDATTLPACPGTARAGVDYEPTQGTLTFGSGEASKTIQVLITDDRGVTGNRTFGFRLGNPRNGATLGTPSQAVVTIADDERGGTVQFGAAAYRAPEPTSLNASVPILVTRTGAALADGASVVLLTGAGTALPGVHYVPLATTVVFNNRETSKTVPLTILTDGAATGDLTVPLVLTSPAGGATLGTLARSLVTIVDANRSVRLSVAEPAVDEGGTATLTVVRGGSLASPLAVRYATGNGTAGAGTDYVTATGTLTFPRDVATLTFTVRTLKRPSDTGNRSVLLTLDSLPPDAVVVGPNPATLTIRDVDGPGTFQFTTAAAGVTEGREVTLTVQRAGGRGGTVRVPWRLDAPTTDLTPTSGMLTFGAGITSAALKVKATENSALDGNRSHTLLLEAPAPAGAIGAAGTATLAVEDRNRGGAIQFVNPAPSISSNVAGGQVRLDLSRTGANLAGGILVDYTVTGDVDAIAASLAGTVTFAAGITKASISLTLAGPTGPQPDRRVVVTLDNPRAASGVGGPGAPTLGAIPATTLTIVDAFPQVQLGAAAYSLVEGNPVTIAVTRSGPVGGAVVVSYATADGTAVGGIDYTATAGALTIPAGAARGTFTVATRDDGVLAGNRSFLVSLVGATGASIVTPSQATVSLLDRQSAGALRFAAPTASAIAGSPVRVTVTRNGVNLIGGVTIGWSATGSAEGFAPASGTLSFGAGVTSQSFDITTAEADVPAGVRTIVVSLEPPTGGAALGTPSAQTVFVIDRQQTLALAADSATVGETAPSATLQIVRNGVPRGTVQVHVETLDGDGPTRAVAGRDYLSRSETITFGPGEITKPFVVPLTSRTVANRSTNRALTVALSAPASPDPDVAIVLGAPSAASLTILNFRADLVIASVSVPGSVLTGKTIAAPSTVRNLGLVAAPAFRIGVFMVRADAEDALLPGAGSLVAIQDVAALAAGASATFPTSVSIADDVPAGDYYVSAVANFGLTVAETDTSNNGRNSAPAALAIRKTVPNLKVATAAFSQGAAPGAAPAGAVPAGAARLETCDAAGSVSLTGTFALTGQLGSTVSGEASLTGTLNDSPVQYVLLFSGAADNDGNLTATLDSVAFRSLATSLTGSGSGSLAGILSGLRLRANVSGQFTTSTGGACVFAGTLEAQTQASSQFRLTSRTDVASFGFNTTPAEPAFPVRPQRVGAEFRSFFDTDVPEPPTVRFTGPPGSGFSNSPANEDERRRIEARYRVTREGATSLPAGDWTVLYKGQAATFTRPSFDASASSVVVFPTVTLDGAGTLTRVAWIYRDQANGSALATLPSGIAGLTVRVRLKSGDEEPESRFLSPSSTSFELATAEVPPPHWSQVNGVTFEFADLAGNAYVQNYTKGFDETPPRLVDLAFAPTTIDTAGGSQEVTLTLQATDDLAGIQASGCSSFRSPSGAQQIQGCTTEIARGGTPEVVTFQAVFTFPRFAEAGTWTLAGAPLSDRAGNFISFSTAALQALGFPTTLEVTSAAPDLAPPTLVSLAFTPAAIDTTASAQPVTLTLQATDDLTGVQASGCSSFRSPSGAQQIQGCTTEIARGGSPEVVTFQAVFTFPRFAEAGTWTLAGAPLSDQAGNFTSFSTAALQALGFPTTLEVTSAAPDLAPPTLVSLAFTPAAIDTTASAQQVSLTLQATDDVSGVEASGCSSFRSPSGAQQIQGCTTEIARGGSPEVVTFQAVFTFPRFSETGTWTLAGAPLSDRAGNFTSFSTAALQALGFPTTLTNTATVSDLSAPTLVSLSFTPTAIITAASAQPVSLTLQAIDDVSGVQASGCSSFRSPSGAQQIQGCTTEIARGGSPEVVTFQAVFTFPQSSELGIWTLAGAPLSDQAGNFTSFSTAALQALGFPTVLEVVTADVTAPTLVSLAFTPAAIDTTASARQVTLTLQATDQLSGVQASGCSSFQSPSGAQQVQGCTTEIARGGSPEVVTFQAVFTFPRFAEAGTWTLAGAPLSDRAGNFTSFSAAALQALGFPTTLTNTATVSDLSAPTLVGLSFTPAVIDASMSAQPVTLTLQASDDVSGVQASGCSSFRSPSGAQQVQGCTTEVARGGSPEVVTFEAVFTFPQFSELGTWTLAGAPLSDRAGNFESFTTGELAALGFATQLEVVVAPGGAPARR